MAEPGPRVTIGLPTYNRHAYLAEALQSCLAQDYEGDFEVLVVVDGSGTPEIDSVLAGCTDPRLRVVRHGQNRGIAAAMNTLLREARGELVATLGDDDVNEPDRIRRQVEVFDRHPDTGVVHGDALIIDERGKVVSRWKAPDLSRRMLVQVLFRRHNLLVDTSTMRHRRVFEAIGPCDESLPWEDFSYHVRAARLFRYRHVGGHPLVRYRRHGENTATEGDQTREIELVERVLWEALDRYDLEELVPELDWAVLDRRLAERQALERLADAFDTRALPLPGLAGRVRARASATRAPATPAAPSRGRLLMTSFGWNDSGGGTIVPRLAAKELARRGWEVTVFHAAVGDTGTGIPYELREWEEDGVRLVGVHNRPVRMLDLGRPDREIDDPPVSAAFADTLDRLRPDVVHFHNLHNLGAALLDEASARGLPSFFSTHNYWLICPRAYLLTGSGDMCGGPGDRGGDCASCVGSPDRFGHTERLSEIRGRFGRAITACMAVSEAMKRTLIAQGYPSEAIDVVRQGMPAAEAVWEKLGRDREPGRVGGPLRVAFFGSALWHKGPGLLVEAAQHTQAELRVEIHGEVPDAFAEKLRALDRRGVVELSGRFHPGDLPELLAGVDVAAMPSLWWDCAPLMAAECLAGRVPLVAPRLGGLAEAVRDEVDGLLFEGLSAPDLARCLDRLAGEPGLLERLQEGIEAPRPFAEYVDELEAYYGGERASRAESERAAAVRWVGDQDLPTSLSIINREVCERLDNVQRVARGGEPLDAPLAHGADVEVRHQWPPDFRPPRSGRLAVIQPWELGAIPRAWVAELEANVDELWVPSAYSRSMYVDSGVEAARVQVIPNGVDLERFRPEGPKLELPGVPAEGTRFLFVGGLIPRKGPDLLLAAWLGAFAGRDDVTLIVKDFGAEGVYSLAERGPFAEHAQPGKLPRLVYLENELSDDEMASLYRSADVLVHPYRGEGFGMPVLEAMACGLPVIVTSGGPTDEFCPEDACWRIPSTKRTYAEPRVGDFDTVGLPWQLEPDPFALAGLMQEAAADVEGRSRRGAAAAAAARALSWDAVAALYATRIEELRARPARLAGPPPAALELEEDVQLRLLAAPAWRAPDTGLEELLRAWAGAAPAGTSACLFLLVGSVADGDPQECLRLTAEAAERAGVDLDRAADVTLLVSPVRPDADASLHAAVDAFVRTHRGADGHERRAALVLDCTRESLVAWLGSVRSDLAA